jgi:MATE family multidrug resistance protein
MGLHAQRAIIILSIATVPVALIWTQTDAILRNVLFIDPVIAASAGRWSTICIISLWPLCMYEIMRKFLQAQKLLWPIIVATIVAAFVHVLNNWLFVSKFGLGFDGAAYAYGITQVPRLHHSHSRSPSTRFTAELTPPSFPTPRSPPLPVVI